MTTYDAIVLGTGGVGSAAMYELTRRGARVLGLDRFDAGHDRGSSHGETRIIRQAYFEHPDYVPLLKRAYELWNEAEQAGGQQLFHQVGLLEVGPPDGVVVPGVLEAARLHDLEIERLTAGDVARRFPGLRIPAGSEAVFERVAGYLRVEACVRVLIEQAVRRGADFRPGTEVTGWSVHGDGIRVQTATDSWTAGRLVICGGPWSAALLADLRIPLPVRRKHLHWYADHDATCHESVCPAFFYEMPEGYFYGFPARDAHGVKVAEHSGGETVADPLRVDRTPDPLERGRVERFLQACLPGVRPPATRHAVCMYTMSPDEHFLLDVHPRHPAVTLAAGLSGHGFKFATVLGQALADLALDGSTRLPIAFLSCRRPAVARPEKRG